MLLKKEGMIIRLDIFLWFLYLVGICILIIKVCRRCIVYVEECYFWCIKVDCLFRYIKCFLFVFMRDVYDRGNKNYCLYKFVLDG